MHAYWNSSHTLLFPSLFFSWFFLHVGCTMMGKSKNYLFRPHSIRSIEMLFLKRSSFGTDLLPRDRLVARKYEKKKKKNNIR